MRRKKAKEKIAELEKRGLYNEDLVDHSKDKVPVLDENYNYFPKNIFYKAMCGVNRFIMAVFGPVLNFVVYGIRIKGRKNLKGVKKAVCVSNHVSPLDSLWVRNALWGRKIYITAAPFNCPPNFTGTFFKSGGMIPIAYNKNGIKNFDNAVKTCLDKNCFVSFCPEQALWNWYEKPRPLKRGAFLSASQCNVPIVPMFICFRKGLFDKIFKKDPSKVTVVIEKPIYPKPELGVRENSLYLMEQTKQVWEEIYSRHYNRPINNKNDNKPVDDGKEENSKLINTEQGENDGRK